MSISGKLSMALLNGASNHIKGMKITINDVEEELQKSKKYNERHRFKMPSDHRAFYKELDIAGYPCLVIRTKKQKVDRSKAILYLHGGITNLWKMELMVARGYANAAGMDVWYPIYPSVSEVNVTKTIEVIYQNYCKMVRKYGADRVAIIGSSFGGTFAFEMINWNNRSANPVGMPALVIANSPGGVPDTEEDWALMEKYAAKDPILSPDAMRKIAELTSFGEEVPKHAICPIHEDFHNAPETYVYYAEETCAGNSDAYIRAYERDGSGDKIHMHIQPGMMHCYSVMPVFPESKRSFSEQIELLKRLCSAQ